jgi:hypothetical protein
VAQREQTRTIWNLNLWDLRWYYERVDADTVYLIIELPGDARSVARALRDAAARFAGWWVADHGCDEDGSRFLRLERQQPRSSYGTVGEISGHIPE